MSICYKKEYCPNCNMEQGGRPSVGQKFLYAFLLFLFIFPGIIYYFAAKPFRCHICGIKKRHWPKNK